MAGLEECKANLVVYLHPSKANCASDAILSELSTLLFSYNETFGGVVLAYDPNIRSNLAKIVPGTFTCFGVQLKAKLLLFNPKSDMVLEGEVVKLTPNSIHAVVLVFSSVVIADDDIRDKFKYKFKGEEEMYVSRTHRKHKIKLGPFFDEEILHISGSLLAHHTGGVRWLDNNLEDWSRADSTATKRNTGDMKLENDTLTTYWEIFLKSDEQLRNQRKKEDNILEV
ncbi:hypothetical protein SASPL_131827 [Salvia splendens]|uniref:DNA-directed RNA polymerase subunit n=1 Tax=Salvia splendens TaxID=180675 RepID=A0A8X8X9Z7_SALSN|nr:hypothetical protein SASPL_131827 [Salvia splendens]